jgi:hypothetical protein
MGVDFARFEFSGMPYRRSMELINAAQKRELLVSPMKTKTPTCTDGRADDIDDAHALPVFVGILGPHDKLVGIKLQFPWAHFAQFRLNDGRAGIVFQLGEHERKPYEAFVSKAASGRFQHVQVVLLRESMAGGPQHVP